jgi:hypothetical protein
MRLWQTKELSYWHKVVSDHFSEDGTFRHDMTNHQTEEKKVFGKSLMINSVAPQIICVTDLRNNVFETL